MKRIFLALAVACLLWGAPAWAYNWQTNGERLTFKVKWGFLTAGEAELLYRPTDNNYTLMARAWTDIPFAHLRERLTVIGPQNADFKPTSFHQMQVENDFKADKWTLFNHEHSTATYDNKRDHIDDETLPLLPHTRDLMSTLYYLRQSVTDFSQPIAPLSVLNLHRAYTVHIQVGKQEKMRTKGGKVAVRKITPVLKRADGKKPKSGWTIWVTDDARRLPLRIDMTSPFGTFKATLTGLGAANSPSAAPADVPETGSLF